MNLSRGSSTGEEPTVYPYREDRQDQADTGEVVEAGSLVGSKVRCPQQSNETFDQSVGVKNRRLLVRLQPSVPSSAGVAQLVERRASNPTVSPKAEPANRKVQGESTPSAPSTLAGEVEDHGVEYIHEAVGSIPAPRSISYFRPFQFRKAEALGSKECPYAYRWTLNLWLFAFRVHKWLRSDDKRHMHDHPWHFMTVVLRGGYTDVSESGRDVLTRGSIRFRRATHRHYAEVPKEGALTFLITTMPVRKWGFWVKGVFKRQTRYFKNWGHPPCDEQ